MAIEAGSQVEVVTASGETVQMRALGTPTRGRDFPVVWVCTEDEFGKVQAGEIDGIPWPMDAVNEIAAQPA